MINVDPNRDFQYHINRASVARALTVEEANTVRDYITANCTGMTTEQIVTKLASPYYSPNPVPQGNITRYSWAPDELNNFLLKAKAPSNRAFMYEIEKLKASPNEDVAELATLVISLVQSKLKEIVIQGNTELLTGLQALVQMNILTQDQVDTLTLIPDPNYQAQIYNVSPLEEMGFGSGALLDAIEVEQVML